MPSKTARSSRLDSTEPPNLRGKTPVAITHKKLAGEHFVCSTTGYDLNHYAAGSGRQMNWRCPNNKRHNSYLQIINRRVKSLDAGTFTQGCPFCRGVKAWSGNCIAQNRELVAQWDWRANGSLRPEEVAQGSRQIIHWVCHRGPDHKWQTMAYLRTRRKHGCPFCTNRQLSVTNSLKAMAPEIAEELHPIRNNGLTADCIIGTSKQTLWWLCAICKHEWQREVRLRTQRGSKCPKCRKGPPDIAVVYQVDQTAESSTS